MREVKEESFNISLPIQIRFSDIDSVGHINNNVYLSYFDIAKINYFETIRNSAIECWTDSPVIIAHIELDFFSPVYYKESIVVDSKIIRMGTKSGTFLQQIRNVKTKEIKCRCTSVFVAYDINTQSSVEIPKDWKDSISAFEKTNF